MDPTIHPTVLLIGSFFGHSVSQCTMMEKMKELREPRLVLQKSKKALSSSKVHIGVFVTTRKLKYSTSSIVT
jgi:hypothetical protein